MVLPAAGAGSRMGSDIPKQFLRLGGKPLLFHCLDRFLDLDEVVVIAVALPASNFPYYRQQVCSAYSSPRLKLVAGGATRQKSVSLALNEISEAVAWVAIHDVARPFFTRQLLARVWEASRETGGAVPGIELSDTVKQVDSAGRILETLDRSRLRRVQTPQVFSQPLLRQCVALAERDGWVGTDEASLLERCGYTVKLVAGLEENIKITSPEDYRWAEAWLQARIE